ncbi:MAG TPA: glycosyltransferase family 4 protein, partial [Acidobacteriota bacterium]|nr:glycosyltransferase family 4 protein [Acidobacteriota bacterium]
LAVQRLLSCAGLAKNQCHYRWSTLHICMITREFPPKEGGIGSYVYNLSKELVRRGHQATVITRGSSRQIRKTVVDGIGIFEVPFIPVYPFHLLVHGVFVQRVLESIWPKPTLVHLHTPVVPVIKTLIPIMMTVHTPSRVDARYQEMSNLYLMAAKVQSMLIYPSIELELMKRSRKVTTVSYSVAEELREYGLKPCDIAVVGNGVDEEIFTPSNVEEQGNRYISCTGGLRGRKGLFDLLNCAAYVVKEIPTMKFVITGKGPFLNMLKKKAKRLGIEKNIIFPGFVKKDRLIQIYRNATIHVIPSTYEGLPTVLLEAMACARPVVATAVGGTTEVIASGINGFLVPSKAPEEMSETILNLLGEPQLRKAVGTAARRTVEERYTWSKITDNILSCYESIIQD